MIELTEAQQPVSGPRSLVGRDARDICMTYNTLEGRAIILTIFKILEGLQQCDAIESDESSAHLGADNNDDCHDA